MGRGPTKRDPVTLIPLDNVDEMHLSTDASTLVLNVPGTWLRGYPTLAEAAGFQDVKHFKKRALDGVGSLMHICYADVFHCETGEVIHRVPFTDPTSAHAAREAIQEHRHQAQQQRGWDSQLRWLRSRS